MSTYTEDQVQARIAEATASLRAEFEDLKKAATAEEQQAQIAAAVEAAVAPLAARITELESAETTLTAELNTVKAERDAMVEANEKAEAEKAAAEEREGRKADRVAKVLEVAAFTDEQVAERADRWADMDDASFETLVEDLKAHATPPSEQPVRRQPLKAAETAASSAGKGLSSEMTTALGYRRSGIKTV